MPVITRLQALTNALNAFLIEEFIVDGFVVEGVRPWTEEGIKGISLYTKQKMFKCICGFHPTKAGQVIACMRWPKV